MSGQVKYHKYSQWFWGWIYLPWPSEGSVT